MLEECHGQNDNAKAFVVDCGNVDWGICVFASVFGAGDFACVDAGFARNGGASRFGSGGNGVGCGIDVAVYGNVIRCFGA